MRNDIYNKAYDLWEKAVQGDTAAHYLNDHLKWFGWRFDEMIPYTEEGRLDKFSIIKETGVGRLVARITFEGARVGQKLKVSYSMNIDTMGNRQDIERVSGIVREVMELMQRLENMKTTDFPSIDE